MIGRKGLKGAIGIPNSGLSHTHTQCKLYMQPKNSGLVISLITELSL